MSIEFKDVAALTGAPGLFHVVKADDRAIIVETLDDKKKRQMIRGNMMLSKLTDISIFTKEESAPLVDVLKAIKEKYGTELPVTKKSSKQELMSFLEEVLPDLDKERVYPSNVKKLLGWYDILTAEGVEFELPQEASSDGGDEEE
ncbi:MAG: DUF5606 domain-containing protein [Bacteroidota bacterium]